MSCTALSSCSGLASLTSLKESLPFDSPEKGAFLHTLLLLTHTHAPPPPSLILSWRAGGKSSLCQSSSGIAAGIVLIHCWRPGTFGTQRQGARVCRCAHYEVPSIRQRLVTGFERPPKRDGGLLTKVNPIASISRPATLIYGWEHGS